MLSDIFTLREHDKFSLFPLVVLLKSGLNLSQRSKRTSTCTNINSPIKKYVKDDYDFVLVLAFHSPSRRDISFHRICAIANSLLIY